MNETLQPNLFKEAIQLASEAASGGKGSPCLTKEKYTDGVFTMVTACHTSHLPTVAKTFSGGYFAWLVDNFQRADSMPACPAFAHWILMIAETKKVVAVHLTLSQQVRKKNKVLAWDLLTLDEFRLLGNPDQRPPEVKRQWGI